MSKKNNLPSVTSNIPRDLRMFLDRVRETLSSDMLSRDDVRALIRNPGPPGGPPGPPGDPPDGPVDAPTVPTNLTATGLVEMIHVQWDEAPYRGHQYTEVWASPIDDIRQGEAVGMAPGTAFTHVVGPEVGRYYWVRFVNRNGAVGPFNSQAGVYAESLKFELPEPPIQDLDDSRLTKLLDDRLQWLEDPTFGLRGEAARIRGEYNALLDNTIDGIREELSLIRDELDDILITEVFDATKAYAVDDLVIWRNPSTNTTFIYQCKLATTPPSPPPSNTTYWNQVGDYASIQAIVDDIASAGLQLQARGLYDGDGEVIGAIAAALLAVRSSLEDEDGNLIDAEALLGLTTRITALETLATALVLAGVAIEQPDGTYIASQAFLSLLTRIETATSNLLANAEWMQVDDAPLNTLPEPWVRAQFAGPIIGTNFSERTRPLSSDGVRALYVHSDSALTGSQTVDIVQERIAAKAGELYQASVYAGSVLGSGKLQVIIQFRNAHDEPVGSASFGTLTTLTKSGRDDVSPFMGTTLDDYQRVHVFSAAAPNFTAFARVIFRITPGTVNPLAVYMTRPMFGLAVAGQTTPSPWVPGMQSNAFRAAAAATLALDTQYKSAAGPFASSTAFLALRNAVEADEFGLAATNSIALGVKSVIEDPVTGLAATAGALDSLSTEVRLGPNSLTSLAQRLSAVSATLSKSGNLAKDVGFTTVGHATETKRQWTQLASGGWEAATFGANLNADYTIAGIPEKVAYIRFVGTPGAGIAQISQEFDKPVALQWYQFSVWVRSPKCRGSIWLLFLDSSGGTLKSKSTTLVNRLGNGTTLSGYERLSVIDDAPSGTTKIRVIIRASEASAANPFVFAVRPLFAEAAEGQTEPSGYLPPVADAFSFDEMRAEIIDGETGLYANASKITGVTNFLVGEGGSLAESGAFQALRSSVSRIGNNVIMDAAFQAAVPSSDGWTSHTNDGHIAEALTATSAAANRRLTTDAERTVMIRRDGAMSPTLSYGYIDSRNLPVVPGTRYQASVYLAPFVVDGRVTIVWYSSDGATISSKVSNAIPPGGLAAGPALATGWARAFVFDVAPTTPVPAAYAIVRVQATTTSGGSNGRLFVVRPHFGVASTTQTEPSDWSPGAVTASSELLQAVDAAITTGSPPTRFSAAAYQVFKASVDGAGGLASQVTGLQTGIGEGGNMLADATFESPVGEVWKLDTNIGAIAGFNLSTEWTLASPGKERTVYIHKSGTVPPSGTADLVQLAIPVDAGKRYQASAYVIVHRGSARVQVEFFNTSGGLVESSTTGKVGEFMTNVVATAAMTSSSAQSLASFQRVFGFGVAPTGAVRAVVRIRFGHSGSGTQTNGYVFVVRPFFGEAKPLQTQPSPWASGLFPPVFAALKAEGIVWADPTGDGTAGATYTMKLRARDATGEANVGFGLGAVKEGNKWVADVRFAANRLAIMDANSSDLVGDAARTWTPSTYYVVGDVRSYYRPGYNTQSGVYRCTQAHLAGGDPVSSPPDNPGFWSRIARYPFVYYNGVTYLDTAVIRDATIGTLMLDGNAVTVPSYIYRPGLVNGAGTWTNFTVMQLTLGNPMPTPMKVMVLFSARQHYPNYFPGQAVPSTGLAILKNGVPFASPAGRLDTPLCAALTDYVSWSCDDEIPAYGSATYMPSWYGEDSNVAIRNRSLLLLGVKR